MDFNGRAVRIVAGQHGNEKGPVRALISRGCDFILGNPEAGERNVRYIDQDLNASYGVDTGTFESKRSQKILDLISPEDVVIDFHTTSAKGPPFAILTDKVMLPLAERTGLAHAVLMTHNIKKGHALINVRDGIAVEISGYDTQESFDTSLSVLDALASRRSSPLTLYEVYGLITEPGVYENFVECEDGFYPVLVGEESYDFIGLKARRIDWLTD
ncbi:MAG: hypothetical protein QG636_166 [Patescibacteria group bacterium]|jgi:hypothetical protein|nr:hypothetical protein [Patescibacteria group bacterium]